MNICLKTLAKQNDFQRKEILLHERLPTRVTAPCQLACEFKVESAGSYYLLTLHVAGQLNMMCQRCAEEFEHDYHHQSVLAVCANDTMAESLMERYECIVHHEGQIDLNEILTDELYLFSPEKHTDPLLCTMEI